MLVLLARMTAGHCHSCTFNARNCTDSLKVPNSSVCDAQYRIIRDDLFCDDESCTCGEDFDCVSLEVGCRKLNIHKDARRCLSQNSLDFRFASCSRQVSQAPSSSNLNRSWVHFNDASKCNTLDCKAAQQFVRCNEVECGHMVSGWKESDVTYHFIVDGSKSKDLSAGEFHFTVPFDPVTQTVQCEEIRDETIENCYNLQTRNTLDGKCIGVYFVQDENATDEDYTIASLTWPAFYAIIGSVSAAGVMFSLALYFYLQSRKERQIREIEEKTMEKLIVSTPGTNKSFIGSPRLRQRLSATHEEHSSLE